ncbi:hypothetical protein Pint_28431 [Pistacia integerrima]|uniref:Uncharacterized protein n=1 Tax=Pistacia integerrima TaxID=434235 RepID=A0ACC0YTW4_9ROSI|nr:hypothetical protein Pint_28431 [Pistacia integerrima]
MHRRLEHDFGLSCLNNEHLLMFLPETMSHTGKTLYPWLEEVEVVVEVEVVTGKGGCGGGGGVYQNREAVAVMKKRHAAAIAQSIQVIKKRFQWKKLIVRLILLSAKLNKPNFWDGPVHAGKISREHGSHMGKMKEVKAFEQ